MTDKEFLNLKKRYYNWKAMQPRAQEPIQVEQAALRWAYEAGRADLRKIANAVLFGETE